MSANYPNLCGTFTCHFLLTFLGDPYMDRGKQGSTWLLQGIISEEAIALFHPVFLSFAPPSRPACLLANILDCRPKRVRTMKMRMDLQGGVSVDFSAFLD
jgi:hypothetical protein